MCGEKIIPHIVMLVNRGSPPHVRGKGRRQFSIRARSWITPACAGKSKFRCGTSELRQDHPRMCGEKSTDSLPMPMVIGSPPHVRGKVCEDCLGDIVEDGSPPHVRGKARDVHVITPFPRITPACAGKSIHDTQDDPQNEDHPRMCGEKTKKIPFNATKTTFSSIFCQSSFNFSYNMNVNLQSDRARCVSLISIPKCWHRSCNA